MAKLDGIENYIKETQKTYADALKQNSEETATKQTESMIKRQSEITEADARKNNAE